MTSSKPLEIIQSFSTEEVAEFLLFLKSPFFVPRGKEEMLRLFNCFVNAATGIQNPTPSKAEMHAMAFQNKSFSQARINRSLSKLNALIEQYITAKNYQSDASKRQRMLDLAKAFRARKIAAQYDKQLMKLKREIIENPQESTENYLFQYQIASEEHLWKSTFNNGRGDLAIPEAIQSLDLFVLNERTELTNRFLLQHKAAVLDVSKMSFLTLDLSNYIAKYGEQSALLLIRKKIQEIFSNIEPRKEDFETLLSLINRHEKKLSVESLKEIFTYLRSFCTILVNSGQSEMQEVLFNLQSDNLNRGYFYHNGQIPYHSLTSITLNALLVNKLEWAKQFVESHRYNILANDTGYYFLNLSLCLFAEKKYNEALEILPFDFSAPLNITLSRRLELKLYYELKSDLLSYKIDAYRKFLERTASKMISARSLSANFSFVNFLLQLYQSKPKDAKRSMRLLNRINGKKAVADRAWLLEKTHELL